MSLAFAPDQVLGSLEVRQRVRRMRRADLGDFKFSLELSRIARGANLGDFEFVSFVRDLGQGRPGAKLYNRSLPFGHDDRIVKWSIAELRSRMGEVYNGPTPAEFAAIEAQAPRDEAQLAEERARAVSQERQRQADNARADRQARAIQEQSFTDVLRGKKHGASRGDPAPKPVRHVPRKSAKPPAKGSPKRGAAKKLPAKPSVASSLPVPKSAGFGAWLRNNKGKAAGLSLVLAFAAYKLATRKRRAA